MKKALRSSLFLGVSIGMFMSCSDDESVPEDPVQTDPAITLDCNYFNEDRILTDNPNAAVDYIIDCVMRVSADIIIEPGVVIEFGQNAGIEIDDFNVPYASLSAEGTAAKPIVFRGAVSGAGYWRGLL
ncbi:MAG: hypothetical protein ITG00_08790, partial [Flavobacterium sp.]|nr:hypothetical protein [Flavobacterium sp.]